MSKYDLIVNIARKMQQLLGPLAGIRPTYLQFQCNALPKKLWSSCYLVEHCQKNSATLFGPPIGSEPMPVS